MNVTTERACREDGRPSAGLRVLLDGQDIGFLLDFGKGRNGGWVGYSIHSARHPGTGRLRACMGPYLAPRRRRASKAEAIKFVVDTHAAWLLLADIPDPLA